MLRGDGWLRAYQTRGVFLHHHLACIYLRYTTDSGAEATEATLIHPPFRVFYLNAPFYFYFLFFPSFLEVAFCKVRDPTTPMLQRRDPFNSIGGYRPLVPTLANSKRLIVRTCKGSSRWSLGEDRLVASLFFLLFTFFLLLLFRCRCFRHTACLGNE